MDPGAAARAAPWTGRHGFLTSPNVGGLLRHELKQVAQASQHVLRTPQTGLALPLLARRHSGGHGNGHGAAAARHDDLYRWVIADDAKVAAPQAQSPCHEAQRVQRGFARQNHWRPGHTPDGADDRVRIAHRPALPGGEERHVGSHIEPRARPDCMTGGLNGLHRALRIPADIHGLNIPFVTPTRRHGFDSRLAQGVPDAGAAQNEHTPHAIADHEIGRNAGRSEQALVAHREAGAAQFRRLLRRRIGAAIGQHHEGDGTTLECTQQLSCARQDFITAQGSVAQQERAVQIEHESLKARQRGGLATAPHGSALRRISAAPNAGLRRSFRRMPAFSIAM